MPDMERAYPYRVVDVFTEQPLAGNPLAVFVNGSDLEGATMQRIARELNLSETVFVGPPQRADCARRLRIFTPRKEMEFAGHPTIGTAFVLLDEGLLQDTPTEFSLEENVGPVRVSIENDGRPLIWLTTPPIREGEQIQRDVAARLLSLSNDGLLEAPPQILDAGNPTLFVPLRDRETVDRASLDSAAWARFKAGHAAPLCVFVFTPTAEGAHSRMFAPDYGVAEDPATGSSTGPLAAFMIRHSLLESRQRTRFQSEQGTLMGRRSILHVRVRDHEGDQEIAVGGYVTPIIDAVMRL